MSLTTPPVSPISVAGSPQVSPISVAGSPQVSPISAVGRPNALNSPAATSFHLAAENEGTPGGTPYSHAEEVPIEGWNPIVGDPSIGNNTRELVAGQLGLPKKEGARGRLPNRVARVLNMSNAALANVTVGGRRHKKRGKKSHKKHGKKSHKKRRSTRRVRFDRI